MCLSISCGDAYMGKALDDTSQYQCHEFYAPVFGNTHQVSLPVQWLSYCHRNNKIHTAYSSFSCERTCPLVVTAKLQEKFSFKLLRHSLISFFMLKFAALLWRTSGQLMSTSSFSAISLASVLATVRNNYDKSVEILSVPFFLFLVSYLRLEALQNLAHCWHGTTHQC